MLKFLVTALALVATPGAALLACGSDSGSAPLPASDGGLALDGGADSRANGTDRTDGGGGADADANANDGGPFTTFHVALTDRGACAVFPDGRMKCWGTSFATATTGIGDAPGEMGAALPYLVLPQRVRTVRGAKTGAHCLIFEDGSLRCWGSGQLGQLGTPPVARLDVLMTNVDLGPGHTALDVEPGNVTCVILDDGSVKCWGIASEGQLGQGNAVVSMTPLPVNLGTGRKAKALTTGFAFTCALLDDDRVKCWGRNNNTITDVGTGGMLGIGGTAHIGNDPGEMGDALQYVRLGTNPANGQPWKVKKIAAARESACAILENDRVKCWGTNLGNAALGAGNNEPYGNTILDNGIPFVDVGTNAATTMPSTVTDLASGEYAICVLLSNGPVRCGGQDAGTATLGRGAGGNVIGDVGGAEMGENLVAVAFKPGRKAFRLWASSYSMCAQVDTTTLGCWGRNTQGMLGAGLPASGASESLGDAPGEVGAGFAETVLE